MAGITKRVYSNRRNVDIGRGVDKNGIPSTIGGPVILRRFTQSRAPNPTKNQPLINGSLYFDGTATSNILIDNGVDFELDGEFTIEWFQYQTNTKGNTASRIFQIGNFEDESGTRKEEFGFSIQTSGNELYIAVKNYDLNNDGTVNSDDAFIGYISYMDFGFSDVYNKWLHFAIVRNNNSDIKLYVNGRRAANVLNTPVTINSSVDKQICIGNETIPSDNAAFEGYITNFRWTKGQSLYTGDLNTVANFQVPTSPVSSLPGTKLLFLAQNNAPFSNGKDAITAVSNITWSPKSPFT